MADNPPQTSQTVAQTAPCQCTDDYVSLFSYHIPQGEGGLDMSIPHMPCESGIIISIGDPDLPLPLLQPLCIHPLGFVRRYPTITDEWMNE